MQIDPSQHSKAEGYKLLTNIVVPRPIAWVTSLGPDDTVNLAPFSFFNAVSSNPLYVMVSVARNEAGELKDTARNILAEREFVVNMVTEEVFDAMNISAADFPPDKSEVDAAGLAVAPSVKIRTPRVAEAQASLECRLHSEQRLGSYTMFIGEVVMFHVADHLVGQRLHIDGFSPIGRMGSPSVYCRTTDRFDIARVTYAQWQATLRKKER
ncbi:flavin reductase family protein [Propionivibrio dicarboxylicus]|uniref:NADH-FMN oxidoreductase RutF, flavin reductase (DIM6/NTAB) family n=1 Tax=Propionivibrio dicarboxylicus TaxID=83767 RepID=A0A1G8EA00_9RHOO|nr:flavin reductase family protein [Propionivibrio dicarboxylicus]SDH66745.1 NADH-FMN oxidoreductase RutF, flavin reductase (DIM6/NTAB) family [Propionivibrio dicarboxylicus]